MRDGFVAKIGAYLDRVGRHLGAEDAIEASHGGSSEYLVTAVSPALPGELIFIMQWQQAAFFNSSSGTERTRVANGPV
jgi:hypothetical protein